MHRRRYLALLAVLGACTAVYWPLLAGRVIANGDAAEIYAPDAQVLLEHARAFALPHWNAHAGLGRPLGGNPESMAYYPVRWLSLLTFDAARSVAVMHLLHVWLAAIGVFLAARRLRFATASASLAALAYAGGPLLANAATRPSLVAAAAWAPFVLWAALDRRTTLRRVAILAGAMALTLLAWTPLVFAGAVVLATIATVRRGWRHTAIVPLAGLWAFALAAVTLVPFGELIEHSIQLVRPSAAFPQPFISVALVVLAGVAAWKARRRVTWLTGAALLLAGVSLVPTCGDLLAAATLPLCLLGGHGLIVVARRIRVPQSAAVLFGLVALELAALHAVHGMPEWAAPSKAPIDRATVADTERVAVKLDQTALHPGTFVTDGLAALPPYGSWHDERMERVTEIVDPILLEMFSVRSALGFWDEPGARDVIALDPWPRAWLVGKTERADDEEAFDNLATQPRLAEKVAYGEGLPVMDEELSPSCSATVERISHEELFVTTECDKPAILVTSDLWFPGWRVENGPPHRLNFLMRGVPVTAGKHSVTFWYRPTYFLLGAALSLLAAIALAAALVVRRAHPERTGDPG